MGEAQARPSRRQNGRAVVLDEALTGLIEDVPWGNCTVEFPDDDGHQSADWCASAISLLRAKIRFASALVMITWMILLAIVAAYALRQADRIWRQMR